MISSTSLSDRRGAWAFALGVIGVTAGVLLHLPMFLMGRMAHYRLYGMPMGTEMYVGKATIILGSTRKENHKIFTYAADAPSIGLFLYTRRPACSERA